MSEAAVPVIEQPTVPGDIKPVVIKLAKQKRSKIKQLLRGEGPLLLEIQASLDELKTAGVVNASAQPVIVVVRERSRGFRFF